VKKRRTKFVDIFWGDLIWVRGEKEEEVVRGGGRRLLNKKKKIGLLPYPLPTK
jgi:hypothetical protein